MRRRHTLPVVAALVTVLFGVQHNLRFKAAKVDQNLPVGKVTTIAFTAPQAGTYVFWCKYHLQMMQGRVTVQA